MVRAYIEGETRWSITLAFHLQNDEEVFKNAEVNASGKLKAAAMVHKMFKDDIAAYHGSRVLASSIHEAVALGPAYNDYGDIEL